MFRISFLSQGAVFKGMIPVKDLLREEKEKTHHSPWGTPVTKPSLWITDS